MLIALMFQTSSCRKPRSLGSSLFKRTKLELRSFNNVERILHDTKYHCVYRIVDSKEDGSEDLVS